MIKDLDIMQAGSIYFLVRPKIGHMKIGSTDDIQHLMLLLNPLGSNTYILIILGKKNLPKVAGTAYFSFVDKVTENISSLKETLHERIYATKTRGDRKLGSMKCSGFGKYIIYFDNDHSYLAYRISKVNKELKDILNLKKADSFIVQIKNINKSASFGNQIVKETKVKFPRRLEKQFAKYKFIPLSTTEFLDYEGAELLLISREKRIPREFNIYLQKLNKENKEYNKEVINLT